MNINELELNLIERVGIDKIKLCFTVENINIPKLLSMNNKVEIHHSSTRPCIRYIPDTNLGITQLIIKDNNIFSDLALGCTNYSNGNLNEYCYLTICVSNIKGYNLENMTYEDYNNYILCVIDYIYTEYEITLNTDNIKIDYLEINANIFLYNDFSKYNRAIRLLISLLSKKLGKMSTYDNLQGKNLTEESFKRGNNSTEIIFYDKIKQLKDMKFPVEDDISVLRTELKLKNKKKIKSAFSSYCWKNLNNKKIVEYFHSQIYKNLSKKFEEWQEKREKELKNLIINCKSKRKNTWHHLLMQEVRNKSELEMIPYILDIEQICDAILKLPDPHRNAHRTIKSLMNISVENDIYKNHDIDKVYEILNNLKECSKTSLNTCQ